MPVNTRWLLRAQSLYFGVTGAWPLVHYSSFERVTGRKRERWLVESVGGLLTATAVGLALAAREPRPRGETVAVSVGSALTLGTVDGVYLARGRLSPVYGVDMLAQFAFLAAWLRS
jgi:hypothetical protein